MEKYIPPYKITDKILDYVSKIMEKIGEINSYINLNRMPELRKQNRINSIHSSLAIENNQLSFFQVEDVINGRMVIGDKTDIQEVKNAYEAYNKISQINPYSIDDLKMVHGIMTFLTVEESGRFRNHGEGVYDGDKCIFVAPSEKLVPELMENLFAWMAENRDVVHPLILSSVFHYEFLFIHPFSDGNGRMARLWQSALLSKWKRIFEYLPIESLIKQYQDDYYTAIANCNSEGESTEFIEFMLKMIYETINKIIVEQNSSKETAQEKIINLIKSNPDITQNEIAEKLNLTRDGISYNMKVLKDKNIIKREGSNKTGRWKIIKK
ncbi:MAG: Fic family protein [Clostridia bacterium]|nr:Fic family protein [Clostridia bacterium]MBP3681632.1 Fic family protein [Clostridia bacterium]